MTPPPRVPPSECREEPERKEFREECHEKRPSERRSTARSTCPACPINRLRALLLHVPYYSIQGPARLAADVGCSRSTVTRLLSGRSRPSFRVAQAVADALTQRSGAPVSARDVFSPDGTFAESACHKMRCRGCLPPEAWDERRNRLKPEWQNARPGEWSRPASLLPASAASNIPLNPLMSLHDSAHAHDPAS
jgi:Helix-turn-helix.